MTDDKWKDALDRITERFTILEQGSESLPEYPNGKREFVLFEGPVGRIRLSRITKPRTIGERAIGSRRIGSTSRVEPIYDLHDLVHFLEAERWDSTSGTWSTLDASMFT